MNNNFNKITGLKNMGNTCFFNSGLQLIFNCQLFNKILLINKFDNLFFMGYKKTIEDYFNSSVNKLGPVILFKILSKTFNQFQINVQSDASEFLLCFFELIENNLNKIETNFYKDYNNNKLYEYLFNCKIISEIRCLETNEKFQVKESEKFLTLPIPDNDNVTFNDCLKEYLKVENLDEDNLYFNEKINKLVKATKQIKILNTPKYLFIILKRFDNFLNKIDKDVLIGNEIKINNCNYNIIGFIIQIGNLNGGHYISCIKRNNIWYLCNDDNISTIDDISLLIKKSYILLFSR